MVGPAALDLSVASGLLISRVNAAPVVSFSFPISNHVWTLTSSVWYLSVDKEVG